MGEQVLPLVVIIPDILFPYPKLFFPWSHSLQTPSADFALLLWLHFHAITVLSADTAELYDVPGTSHIQGSAV